MPLPFHNQWRMPKANYRNQSYSKDDYKIIVQQDMRILKKDNIRMRAQVVDLANKTDGVRGRLGATVVVFGVSIFYLIIQTL